MHIKEFKYFYQKNGFSALRNMIQVIRIPDLDPDFLPIPDPDPGSQIPNPGIKKATDP